MESSTSSTTARSVSRKYAMRIGKATTSRSIPQAMSLRHRALTEQSRSSPIRWAICITIPAGSYATRFDAGRITKEDAVSYLKSLQKQLRRKLRRGKIKPYNGRLE